MFHRFHTKVGQFLLHILRRRPLCKLDAFLLLSINGDLASSNTIADAGFHYCQRYSSKRTRCLGRFPELVLRSYALRGQTRSNELRGITTAHHIYTERIGSQNSGI